VTLRCLAAHGFDRGATATELIVHRNTVLYRIQRIQKLTGLDLQSPIDQNLVYLAILWNQIKPQAASGSSG
jgi:DNA-binding PucR family transcriptional regulator